MKKINLQNIIALDKGWVIANHILVSFHVAFISSVLSIGLDIQSKGEVLKFMFLSYETLLSLAFLYITFHTCIAIHEMGHYLKAVKINALNETLLRDAQKNINSGIGRKFFWYLEMFFKIPSGRFGGITKTKLDYHPDAPYNLAVAAAGPSASKKLSSITLPIAIILLYFGLTQNFTIVIYIGRLFLGFGLVSLLDFLLADPGKYKEFKQREKKAEQASKKTKELTGTDKLRWIQNVKKVKAMMIHTRIQKVALPDGREEWVPWEFRNCGMGGRHTEKEFPESNISLQESMFIPLSVKNYEDAQEMTVNLQTRLKEIIENAEGCTVKGIGSEGGIAAYIRKGANDTLPVQRLWRMQKQAILDCGYIPGKDVAMALDPAASELENAYRDEKGLSAEEGIGMYLSWRDKDKVILSRDELLEIFTKAIDEDDLPIVSIEDGFAEDDDAGWKLLMDKLSDKIHIIGDDNITTKDSSIEEKADKGLINTALIKLNQIGTVTEGVLALLTAIGKNLETVVSHRSKSPIEDFEAQVALAAHSLGLKAGGGANSERLYKYESVTKVIKGAIEKAVQKDENVSQTEIKNFVNNLEITEIIAREASTNAGIPTVAVEIKVGISGSKEFTKLLTFEGATPLGTSAGTDEAIHLVDSIIPANSPIAKKYPKLFNLQNLDKTYRFKKAVTDKEISIKGDTQLSEMWRRANRYNGKGCLNVVENVENILAKEFIGKKIFELGDVVELDRTLLKLERDLAIERATLSENSSDEEKIKIMQRKGNLGMNAVLSTSLALSRLKGTMSGKEFCEVMQEQMTNTIAKIIAENGGLELLDSMKEKMISQKIEEAKYKNNNKFSEAEKEKIIENVNDVIEKIRNKKTNNELWKVFAENLTFENLCSGLQIVNQNKKDEIPLYQLIRKQLPVYQLN
ncbi:MAG: hypothetical protein H8E33_00400 [Candidatus Cloacimonetes bacterium]|nr:hypothetical protein [Candidatus Cloacimonadota bacterium]